MQAEKLLKNTNAELAKSRDEAEAEAATRAKSAFLASRNHEICLPMNATLGLTHLVRHNKPATPH